MKEIQLVNSARSDISKAINYYQQTGVGEDKFKELVTKRIDQIALLPSGLLPTKPDIKSSPLSINKAEQNSFPYHIYYSSTKEFLIILRVFHTRQHPSKAFNYSDF